MPDEAERRPIPMRSAHWATSMASALVKSGLKPNQVSLFSVVFACLGSVLLIVGSNGQSQTQMLCSIGAAACILLRLLCNMLDGMMAVEGGMPSKLGVLYNEVPDRIADIIFLVSAGFAAGDGAIGAELGFAASVLAVMTAYIRAFGAAQGLKQDFCGPMAKPHRMALLTVACLIAAVEALYRLPPRAMTLSLLLIVMGTFITCIRRTVRLARALENRR